MGLFRPYQSNEAGDQGTDKPLTGEDPRRGGQAKGSPTPSRREAEQMRREQLRPTLSKSERKAREREVRRAREEKAFAQAEMAPQRVLLRNYIDSRWTFSEFSWPFLFGSLAIFIAGTWYPPLTYYASYAIWSVMAGVIFEVTFLWFRFRGVLESRLPGAPRRGLIMYMASRMVSMRRFRRPPTAIDRGAEY